MARDKKLLRSDLLTKAGVSTSAISHRMASVQKMRPMTVEDSLYVVAARAGIKLSRYALEPDVLQRVAAHLEVLDQEPREANPKTAPSPKQVAEAPGTTRASRIAVRDFHELVVKRSRRSFTSGEYQDAILKAFRSVNNRVKTLAGTHQDGQKLMSAAFRSANPLLAISDLTTESERNEHEGTRFMLMGAMSAMRNPRAHEDHWPRDEDEAYVLDALSFASLLHRILDIAEARQKP